MGLPYAHVIHTRLTAGQQLQIGDFHEHWWIKDEIPQQEAQGELEATVRNMLQTLEERYHLWPAHRQATFRSQLTQMAQDNDPSLQNPLVQGRGVDRLAQETDQQAQPGEIRPLSRLSKETGNRGVGKGALS
ncbi:hypothetical protein PsorP6_009248 [Peronosclerospora sorghi]|uniref:Uncharacterized protein n=1 Tax=Peronosclerospora sorghi TaxID=230839 RepID=A0ACC0VYD6_9STRA|nr:hypothetical protein PsorP6_009248 [Peronosclerospora sorghi]